MSEFAIDPIHNALLSSDRALAATNRTLLTTFESLNGLHVALMRSRFAIEQTRARLAEPPPEALPLPDAD